MEQKVERTRKPKMAVDATPAHLPESLRILRDSDDPAREGEVGEDPKPPVQPSLTVTAPDFVTCEIDHDTFNGSALVNLLSGDSEFEALGNAVAAFEDAMLKRLPSQAGDAAFDIAWLARECLLRRGEPGITALGAWALRNKL